MPSSRRTALLALAGSLGSALAGCASDANSPDSGTSDTPVATTSKPEPSTHAEPTTSDAPTQSATATPVFHRAGIDDRPAKCPTDDGHLTGTTPIPAPERPSPVTEEEAVAYAEAYERYYLRYRAMFELGGQTPDGQTDVSAHEFPDVRMDDLAARALDSAEDWVLVRLAYDRVFEGDARGAYTVTYDVSAGRTVRAETDGRVDPGPNPAETGSVQRC